MGNTDKSKYMHSYLGLRRAVGWIGILLPIVLVLAFLIIGECRIPSTVSQSYHTFMRDIFVGSLCAIGLFLFFYIGYERDKREQVSDNQLGNIAGFFAILTALFYAVSPCLDRTIGVFEYLMGEKCIGTIHNISAVILFSCFSWFCFKFTKTDKIQKGLGKKNRNKVYITCAYTIIFLLLSCIIIVCIPAFERIEKNTSILFFLESFMIFAFGFSWFIKGETLRKTLKNTYFAKWLALDDDFCNDNCKADS